MSTRNLETYRAGHEAFNRRDFDTMVSAYAANITWTDQPRAVTFRTPRQFQDEFLAGWVQAFSDCQVIDADYLDAGDTVVSRFTVTGTHDGPLGPFPATGRAARVPMCELWHFDSAGRVIGGDLYYDQVTLLMQLELMPQSAA